MKKIRTFLPLCLILAMATCNKSGGNAGKDFLHASPGVRYRDEIFTDAQIGRISDVLYRDSATEFAPGDTLKRTLKLDYYEPLNDTATGRALIIFIHGGAFVDGGKEKNGVDTACRIFARHGFIVAAIDYRLDPSLSRNKTLTRSMIAQELFRAVQDTRYAIRFAKSNHASARIDTNYVYVGGGSAGAVTALHCAYLNDSDIIATRFISEAVLGKLDFGGARFHATSRVRAAFAFAGGLADTGWIQSGSTPAACVHSTGDNLIPIDCGIDGAFHLLSVCGGRQVCSRLAHLNIKNSFKLYNDPYIAHPPADPTHGSVGIGVNLDQDIQFVCDFLYRLQ